MKPPMTGPTTGPIKGPTKYTAIAEARSLSEKMSLTTPPLHATGALPTKPARNRKTRKDEVFRDKAQPRLNARKKRFAKWRTHKRPYTSDKGAANKGPIANERMRMLRVKAVTVGSVMPYFMARSGNPGAMIELANGVTKE